MRFLNSGYFRIWFYEKEIWFYKGNFYIIPRKKPSEMLMNFLNTFGLVLCYISA